MQSRQVLIAKYDLRSIVAKLFVVLCNSNQPVA